MLGGVECWKKRDERGGGSGFIGCEQQSGVLLRMLYWLLTVDIIRAAERVRKEVYVALASVFGVRCLVMRAVWGETRMRKKWGRIGWRAGIVSISLGFILVYAELGASVGGRSLGAIGMWYGVYRVGGKVRIPSIGNWLGEMYLLAGMEV